MVFSLFNTALFAQTQGVPDIVANLFPNLPNFIAHVLATIVLVIVLSKWVYKPFRQAIDKHREKINEVLTDAIEKQSQANIQVQKANSLLENAKTESLSIIKSAKIDAEAQKNQIIDNATTQARSIQNQAKNSIAQERLKAEDEIKNTIVNLAFGAAEKILNQEIDKEKNKQLVDEFIKNLD
ncbi:F0F1 ATP synthase subunit B [Mycoplasma cottewii]|uniref:ATP synthase subunit b n=1 Tax=Mycoplasma cottewii TaxID=51364 RepID=A0ABY5U0Z1_9MOLU|nr:F0F1 ATP synthase subunit B [Mycoplasma cottewii]UWD35153.1 F0F1 ATP synthase subunit B [Mycoplasma cottewii]